MPAAKGWLDRVGASWRVLARRPVYANRWIAVEEFDTLAPTGAAALYGKVSFANLAVGVLPLWDDGTVTLVGQQRFTFDRWSWEMPEGGVPVHDDPLAGAQRELREETGLSAGDWRKVLEMDLSNSVTDERAICFVATDLQQGDSAPDETEALHVVRAPFSEVLHAALAGKVRDSLTVATLLRTHHMAVTGDLPPKLAGAVLG